MELAAGHSDLEKMTGENASPLHPNCRCSCSAYEDSEDYEAWLDFLSKGGTTEEWKKYGKSVWKGLNTRNLAKAIDSVRTDIENPEYTKEAIFEELQKSPVGLDTIRAIQNSDVQISLVYGEHMTGTRGDQYKDEIKIYENNIANIVIAGQTVIHEMAHYRFKIGGCQHAEAICFAMEKMHIMGRDYLTADEWEYVKGLAIDNYPRYNWEKEVMGIMSSLTSLNEDKLTSTSKESDKIKGYDCGEGIYIPLSPEDEVNYFFTCNKCGSRAHFDPCVEIE